MAEMLELERQFLVELAEPVLCGEILHGRADKALGDFKGGFDFYASRRTRVEDRDDPGEKRRDEIDGPYRDEKLGPDRPVIPKLLQHDGIVSTPALPNTPERR
jgi:hypothetical protein